MKVSYKDARGAVEFSSLEVGDTFYHEKYSEPLIKLGADQAFCISTDGCVNFHPTDRVVEVPCELVADFENPY